MTPQMKKNTSPLTRILVPKSEYTGEKYPKEGPYEAPYEPDWRNYVDNYKKGQKKKKQVTIMRGLPGSGKSTYITEHWPGAVVASADHFFEVDGEYRYEGHRIGEAHQHCLRTFIKAVDAEIEHIVVDNTNMESWEYANYVLIAKLAGYKVRIVCMSAGLMDDMPLLTLFERGSHGVPLQKLEQMKERFEPDAGEEYV